MIRLPLGEQAVSGDVRKFNGKETTVKVVHTNPKAPLPQFILDGVESELGKPYFFLKEWLIPLDEVEV